MLTPSTRQMRFLLTGLLAAAIVAPCAHADEIRLKDGKKLYGVIVAYEDNMFKVKTDFGYVLVEKDKIAAIIPMDAPPPAAATAKNEATPANPAKAPAAVPKSEPVVTAATEVAPAAPAKKEKAPIVINANARPEIPVAAPLKDTTAPAIKPAIATPKAALATTTAAPVPPKEEKQEEITGNLYLNHHYGIRMYKAPSWQVIDGANQALPNAIVAMGTTNESTLMVLGREDTKATLENSAKAVEKRISEVYQNYRLISERKTVVSGLPAIEYRYRGLADDHDWSGTLVVVSRAGEIFTALGMTYADTDLIQIQENVIARAIASIDLNAH